ncbi:MAG: vitamin B12 dependent methionine synthase [Desulfosporosinus sp.]|nr:vitamin B12 dependent methionine synthase [Desulfosporosinus sp.]MBC2727074.1 vitamin B12 dependent methionine synthase [Desulfosporosinus sp.]HBV88551.1 vitamin B12 dependent methionine synthase [Desulfosporosinus sp.]
MEPVVLDNIYFEADLQSLVNELHVNSFYFNEFKRLVEQASAIARPKAVYKKTVLESSGDNYVVVEGAKLNSRVVKVNLKGISEFFPAIVTCGKELSEWANSFDDMLINFWANALAEKAMRLAKEALEVHLKEKYQIEAIAQMNPGSVIDWNIQEQRKLFEIIGDVKELIGAELTDSSLIIPMKSISGIWFPNDTYENCILCSRECPNRKAVYDPKMYESMYK